MKAQVIQETVNHSLKGTLKFPQIIGELLKEGVEAYHVDLVQREGRYYNSKGETINVPLPLSLPRASQDFSTEGVKETIKKSQQAQINYPTFLEEILKSGCVYYIVYLEGKKAVYLGRKGELHIEPFPSK